MADFTLLYVTFISLFVFVFVYIYLPHDYNNYKEMPEKCRKKRKMNVSVINKV